MIPLNGSHIPRQNPSPEPQLRILGSISNSVRSALSIATANDYRSIAFPIIGSGTGGFSSDRALAIMQAEVEANAYQGVVYIVRFMAGK